ncbi:hypothetical protein ABT255_55515 [Streptomyces mirabilis]|uniref:hypothetical protein n=1 Tax=Streptomyces mirabilis TaxID=68239 RepID=UPI003329E9F5
MRTRAAAAAASFALSRGWAEKDAEEYGETYARMNTEVSQRVHAEANTIAGTVAHALAFATGEAEGLCARLAVRSGAGVDRRVRGERTGPAGPAGQEARTRLRHGLAETVGCGARTARSAHHTPIRSFRQPFTGPPLMATRRPQRVWG